MSTEKPNTRYGDTQFAKELSIIKSHPEVVDSKEKLLEFWQLALAERDKNKSIQDRIATEAARHIGTVVFNEATDSSFHDVILQFLYMDHMHEGYGDEADKEWEKLSRMLAKLKSN